MEKWIKKNSKYVIIVLLALFLMKTVQSCNRKQSVGRVEKTLTFEMDSIVSGRNVIIDSLKQEILTREFIIKDLTSDLKIAGVRVDEAGKRADAVQRTADRIKTNTTIEIKGAEKDTTNQN